MAKVWKDYPSTSTPITAAALNDLERRVDLAVDKSRQASEAVATGIVEARREIATTTRKLELTIAAPSGQKAHQSIPPGATPVIKSVFHAGSTNQFGQIIVPVTGGDLTGWHSAVAIPTNFSNTQHDARCTVTGTHAQGPVLTFTNGQGHRMANVGIGVTVIAIGWKA